MCQLSFISTTDLKLSRNIAQLQGITNTLKSHNDGYGIFSNHKVFKTKETPVLDDNFFYKVNLYFGSTGILHVRRASAYGNKNIKAELRDEDAHPFQEKVNGSILTLAHNGTLIPYPETISKVKEFQDLEIIDSFVFLKTLGKNMTINKCGIVQGLQETMQEFYGKFAFMINYKKNYYIVRGKRATLFQVKILLSNNKEALIINTERDSLVLMLSYLRKTVTDIYGDIVYISEISPITILPEETIFIYNPQKMILEKIGDIKENIARTIVHTSTDSTHSRAGRTIRNLINRKKNSEPKQLPEPQIVKPFDKNTPFMDVIKEANLTIIELSHLFTVLYGISILEADINYIEDFEEKVIKLVNGSAFNKRIKTFDGLLGKQTKSGRYITRYGIATSKSLEPIYFLNTPREMEKLLKL